MIVGIETGGTKVVCAVAEKDLSKSPQIVDRFPTTSPDETLRRISDFIADTTGPAGPEAIGIASFGPLNLDENSPRYGRLLTTPKAGWSGADIIGPFSRRFGAPIALMTDVTGALHAESSHGAARDQRDVAYVTVGTGIGAGLLVDGQVVSGTGYPEVGHVPVRRHPHDDFAGVCRLHKDCLEGLASGPAIESRWGADLPRLAGDTLQAAVNLEAFYVGQLLGTLFYTLGIRVFVVGGGVANWPGLRDKIKASANTAIVGAEGLSVDTMPLAVLPPRLGGLAGVSGALSAAAALVTR